MLRPCKCSAFEAAMSLPRWAEQGKSKFVSFGVRYHRFKLKTNMYKLREERDIKPSTFGELVSSTLYEKRYGSS